MQLVCPRARPRPQALPARGLAAQVTNLKNELVDPDAWAAKAGSGLEKVLAEAYTLYQRRLRQAHALDFDDLIMTTVQPAAGLPGGGRALPAAVPARAGRRIPGHQPRAVRAGQGAGRARGRRSAAGRAVRGRRRRPVDLRVPGRDDPQHPGVRARLPGRAHDPAGAELPLHPDDPDRGQRGDRPQPRPQAQAPVERPGAGRADRRVRRRQRARRGRLGGPRDRPADRRRARSARPTSRSSTAPTRSPGSSRRCSSGSACPTRWSAGCASTSARRSATRWPTCGLSPTTTTRSACAGSSTPRAAGIGDRAEACVEALAVAGPDLLRRRAAPGRRGARASPPARPTAIADFVALLDELRAVEAGEGTRRRRCWRRSSTRSGYLRRAGGEHRPAGRGPGGQPAGAGQRGPGVHRARPGPAARPTGPPWPDFLEQVALVADADQIPRRPGRHRRRGHADDAAHGQGPGVPGGVPDRPGGRRLPAPALAGRHRSSWRRSAGWRTSASPGPGSGSTCPAR